MIELTMAEKRRLSGKPHDEGIPAGVTGGRRRPPWSSRPHYPGPDPQKRPLAPSFTLCYDPRDGNAANCA